MSSTVLTGVPVVPGVAFGPVVRPVGAVRLPEGDAAPVPAERRPAEQQRFAAAVDAVARRLAARASEATGPAAEVLAATVDLVRDRGLLAAVEAHIRDGASAEVATVRAVARFVDLVTGLGGVPAERATDVRDVRDRLVAELTGQSEPALPRPEVPSVLLADDLPPADAAAIDPGRLIGLATHGGGPTGHTAIIARQLGLPCVVGIPGLDGVPVGASVLLDGEAGTVTVDPDQDDVARRTAAARGTASALAAYRGPGATRDGHPVPLLANVQDGAEAQGAAAAQAEGVGLLRTELAFLGRAGEPPVEEQAAGYAAVFDAFPGRTVVVRTFDTGSDKHLGFAARGHEANPALGLRGLRLARRDPHLLDRQLDAVAEAARRTGSTPWVMAPMVTTVAEAADFGARVRARGLVPGVTVEVPAAALQAERLLEVVDFLSIGTNDHAQYTMAADRGSAELADLTDPWQPAVLALVRSAAEAGRRTGKPVGVCGEAAADPMLACVLVGLGVSSLSCAVGAIAGVGARLATVELAGCRAAADAALAAADASSARAAARAALTG